MFIYIHIYITTINEKLALDLKGNKEGNIGGFGRRKEMGGHNVIRISKNKVIFFLNLSVHIK